MWVPLRRSSFFLPVRPVFVGPSFRVVRVVDHVAIDVSDIYAQVLAYSVVSRIEDQGISCISFSVV